MKPSRRALARYAVDALAAGASPAKLARSLSATLTRYGRTKEADLLIADIADELEARKLVTQASVTSAHALSGSAHKKLEAFVKQMTGSQEVVINNKVDTSVIGGFRIETARRAIDKTVAHQISELKRSENA